MPKFLCHCGEVLRLSGEIPNPIEWLTISEVAFDQFSDAIDAEQVYGAMTHMLRCPSCQRLWVFWDGFQNAPTVYIVDGSQVSR